MGGGKSSIARGTCECDWEEVNLLDEAVAKNSPWDSAGKLLGDGFCEGMSDL
jgi:hypothetical protein